MIKKIRKYLSWLKAGVECKYQKMGGYEVDVMPGKSPVLYVAFSGIGDLQKDTVSFEWRESLKRASEGAHVILVKDNLRQWYTNPNGQSVVATTIAEYIRRNEIESTLALGMSMGGYGAVVFSSLVRFDAVVALSTRECVGKASIFDKRNQALMKNIVNGPQCHIKNLINPTTHYSFISSVDQVEDLLHFMRLKDSCSQGHYFLARGSHNLGHEMIMRGAMQPFLKWLLGNCLDTPPKGINTIAESTLKLTRYLLKEEEKNIDFLTWKHQFSDVPLNEVPFFLLHNTMQLAIERGQYPLSYPLPSHAFISPEWIDPYLSSGWRRPESSGVWSKGKWHVLNGQLVDRIKGRYQLRLQLEAFFPKKCAKEVAVEFYQRGELTKTVKVKRSKKLVFVSLPLLPDERQVVSVTIHTPNADFPSRTYNNADDREVGIFLKGFVVLCDE
ncbi:hypothetical protein [Halomonas citrativorans]|uniref:Alpha/beta hydrolase n=1 Tax=Halomonas citrativorans TaxID=2742612 RepID=A0ABR9FGZ3_9GAMM|nr:hypothetical protein [Halomonas citrativorans]MBE0405170.1 hypothetical protein [Halomonas citrativorans]